MSLISQFVTHFWSRGLWGVGCEIVGSIFSLLSEFKRKKDRCDCRMGVECSVQGIVV